jgi:hypothetical protein
MHGDHIPITVTDRLASIVAGLLNVVGKHSRSGLLWVIGGLVGQRIMKARNRIVDLIARLEAGKLRQCSAGKEPATPRRAMDAAARQRLVELGEIWGKIPRKWGWLVGLVGWEAAGYASQLSHWLQDPQVQKHLAATPRMARALRPICRMLGIDRALLGLPPVERKRRQAAAGASVMGRPSGTHRATATTSGDGKDREPSRAEIKRIMATRRWPSIEMQANPARYKWYPQEPDDPGKTEENSG